jgi:hypothetical protein
MPGILDDVFGTPRDKRPRDPVFKGYYGTIPAFVWFEGELLNRKYSMDQNAFDNISMRE